MQHAQPKMRRRSAELLGYDLSMVSPPRGRLKYKKVCDEAKFVDGAWEHYTRAACNSVTEGGVLGRIITLCTAANHWQCLRTFVTVIGLKDAPDGSIDPQQILTRANIETFFKHVQASPTARGTAYMPSTVKTMTSSLVVLVVIFVKHGTRGQGITRKQQHRVGRVRVARVRALGKSARQHVAGEGAALPPVGVVDDQDEALALPAMQLNRVRFVTKRMANLKKRTARARLAGASAHKVQYMKLRYSKMKAALLANDFMMQTTERIGTVHKLVYGRTVKRMKTADGIACWRPVGPASRVGKTEATKRMQRGYAGRRKILSQAWTDKLDNFIKHHLRRVRLHFLGNENAACDVLHPQLRDGEDAFALFHWWPKRAFGRAVAQVTRATSNNVRGAVEDALKSNAALGGNPIHPDVVQYYVGKRRDVSIKHYQAAGQTGVYELVARTVDDDV